MSFFNYLIERILYFLILFGTLPLFAGNVYYFDPDASGAGNGTYENPFYTVYQVNQFSFKSGDDLYFKAGSFYTVPPGKMFNITWQGTENDKVIIGAYISKDQFGNGTIEGLQGHPRPILDGNFAAPGSQTGLINNVGAIGHVVIQDLQVQNVDGYAIRSGDKFNPERIYINRGNKVLNCYTKNSTYEGILFHRTSYGLIEGNIVEHASYGRRPGAGLEVSSLLGTAGSDEVQCTYHNVVRNNRVFWCYEGIGVYGGARYTLVENNIVHDCRSFHLYKANARNAIFRNNIVYENSDNQLIGQGGVYDTPEIKLDYLIGTDCEGHNPNVWKNTGELAIYNNVMAGGIKGIFVLNNCTDILRQNNNKIFNNTIVDCIENFYFNKLSPNDSGNEIRNNISWTISDDSKHANNFSPGGIKWDRNNFSSYVSGNSMNSAVIGDPGLRRISGWRYITVGQEDINDWALVENSINIDAKGFHAKIAADGSGLRLFLDTSLPFWPGDWIAIDNDLDGKIDLEVQISSVDYANNTVELSTGGEFIKGGYVYYKRSQYTPAFYGSSLDRGALEYMSTTSVFPQIPDQNGRIKIYPNPAQSVLYIENSSTGGNLLLIELFSPDGKILYHSAHDASSGPCKIDISAFRAGLYFVRATQGNEVFTEKIYLVE